MEGYKHRVTFKVQNNPETTKLLENIKNKTMATLLFQGLNDDIKNAILNLFTSDSICVYFNVNNFDNAKDIIPLLKNVDGKCPISEHLIKSHIQNFINMLDDIVTRNDVMAGFDLYSQSSDTNDILCNIVGYLYDYFTKTYTNIICTEYLILNGITDCQNISFSVNNFN